MEPRNNGWVQVIVFEYPSPKRPIIVNTYWYATRHEAELAKRRVQRRSQPDFEASGGKVIAHRVRPAIVMKGKEV